MDFFKQLAQLTRKYDATFTTESFQHGLHRFFDTMWRFVKNQAGLHALQLLQDGGALSRFTG